MKLLRKLTRTISGSRGSVGNNVCLQIITTDTPSHFYIATQYVRIFLKFTLWWQCMFGWPPILHCLVDIMDNWGNVSWICYLGLSDKNPLYHATYMHICLVDRYSNLHLAQDLVNLASQSKVAYYRFFWIHFMTRLSYYYASLVIVVLQTLKHKGI